MPTSAAHTSQDLIIEADQEFGARINAIKHQHTRYSDIVDDKGHQYVDLVLEGGGMLGIALVGYVWAMEQAGIRFLGVAGTSAGSIVATMLAALDAPARPKAEKMLDIMAATNFYDFVDGGYFARQFVASALKNGFDWKTKAWLPTVLLRIWTRKGLNPGDTFTQWVENVLAQANILTLADLQARMGQLPVGLRDLGHDPLPSQLDPNMQGLLTRVPSAFVSPADAGIQLAVIAADVSSETKAVFPRHAAMYFDNHLHMNPARFVRASMSIPLFFEPVEEPLPGRRLPSGDTARVIREEVGLSGPHVIASTKATFVDGGVMSNFPIDIFHDYTRVPAAPTFGAKLQNDERNNDVSTLVRFAGAIFNSARHCLDYEFFHNNQECQQLITWIPCKGANWLDFNMNADTQRKLFMDGAHQALSFLETFNWETYVETRAHLLRKTVIQSGKKVAANGAKTTH